ncbi:MAG: hypothetical protein QW733_02820 [Desulfurococcaceae archaeon]
MRIEVRAGKVMRVCPLSQLSISSFRKLKVVELGSGEFQDLSLEGLIYLKMLSLSE